MDTIQLKNEKAGKIFLLIALSLSIVCLIFLIYSFFTFPKVIIDRIWDEKSDISTLQCIPATAYFIGGMCISYIALIYETMVKKLRAHQNIWLMLTFFIGYGGNMLYSLLLEKLAFGEKEIAEDWTRVRVASYYHSQFGTFEISLMLLVSLLLCMGVGLIHGANLERKSEQGFHNNRCLYIGGIFMAIYVIDALTTYVFPKFKVHIHTYIDFDKKVFFPFYFLYELLIFFFFLNVLYKVRKKAIRSTADFGKYFVIFTLIRMIYQTFMIFLNTLAYNHLTDAFWVKEIFQWYLKMIEFQISIAGSSDNYWFVTDVANRFTFLFTLGLFLVMYQIFVIRGTKENDTSF